MDPVMAICTVENLPRARDGRQRRELPPGSGVSMTGPAYRGRMTQRRMVPAARQAASPGPFPGPRDALDSGSVAELVEDGRGVQLTVARPRPWPVQHHDIVVPTGAPSLLDGLGGYGS